MRQFRIRHREKLRLQAIQYRKKNALAISERRKAARAINPEIERDRDRARNAKNPERSKAQDKAFRERRKADPERLAKHRAVVASYRRNKRHNDMNYLITSNIRARIGGALRYQNGTKAFKTIDVIGCSVQFLRGWIESKFSPGMSWSNYGEWQIDHISPCTSFVLTEPSQQRLCFHYTNLQPLWKSHNISKGNKPKKSHQPELPIKIL